MRWTRMLRLTSVAYRVRQNRVVLTPRRWRQVLKKLTLLAGDGGKKAVHRGDHDISRKAIAQGRPDALRWTCMLVCAFFVQNAHETAGAARTRSSLRPLSSEGGRFPGKPRAHRAARMWTYVKYWADSTGQAGRRHR